MLFTAVAASHGLLDAMTDGGLGIGLLTPFSSRRYFWPWRPIPVAYIHQIAFLRWGWRDFATEFFMIWPVALLPVVWQAGPSKAWRLAGACALIALSGVAWAVRI